ncbi:hypothetical protein P775_16400 [Puniceibacterium antarcticum]|uniref:DUF2059 domain-containing protein n=1 Tax=Puniceibacterium antarcticum TaxID=1206336 RepID=A0A2G8RC30_9RHOB|nr:hypothetical protein [Puniceibacterium antarcticum]PIL19090.1 hypothetical protein P775_16400 [Puniceibacterium antarcticum]
MKRLMIATALTASLSTAAFAATEAEVAQIQALMPNVDASTLSDTEVANAMAVISSSSPRTTKMNRLNDLFSTDMTVTMAATPTEAQFAQIERYAPDVDYTTVTQAQVDTALNYINSDMSDSDIAANVKTVMMDDGTRISEVNTATAAEQAILQRYLPEMTVDTLTEAQLNSALAVVYSGGNESDISQSLEAMVN